MSELIKSGAVADVTRGGNIAYLLSDNDLFLLTGYKVIKNQHQRGFVNCAKVMHNGQIKMVYFTETHKSLLNLIPSFDGDAFLSVLINLLNGVIGIRNNGFLLCQNLDLTFDRIFVDSRTLAVSLIYLPLKQAVVELSSFENELRTNLIKLITGTPSLGETDANYLCADLSNGSLSLDELLRRFRERRTNRMGTAAAPSQGDTVTTAGSAGSRGEHVSPQPGVFRGNSARPTASNAQPVLRFASLNAPLPINFNVNKPEFVIGSNVNVVDGPITFNKAISRVHCKFEYVDQSYYLVDLGSANGTFINKLRIPPSQRHPVKNGDVVRLANSDFMIQI
ncbi:MAG TPA: FHA domain-containing protein [Clostridiaceae bacterium]|nr:FHA domain-containing protein [Clostridiaceae bacterium]